MGRLRWNSPVKVEWDHPIWWLVMSTTLAVAFALRPMMDWHRGRWTPSLGDALFPLAGLVLSAACVVPDLISYRRRRDEYIKRVSRQGCGLTSWSWLLWYVIVRALPPILGTIVPVSRYDNLLVVAGACLGLAAWYPFTSAVSKRQRELQAAADERFQQVAGVPITPVRRS